MEYFLNSFFLFLPLDEDYVHQNDARFKELNLFITCRQSLLRNTKTYIGDAYFPIHKVFRNKYCADIFVTEIVCTGRCIVITLVGTRSA